jgi:hypothetical protein
MRVNIARPTRARIRPLPPEDRYPEAKALIDTIAAEGVEMIGDLRPRSSPLPGRRSYPLVFRDHGHHCDEARVATAA